MVEFIFLLDAAQDRDRVLDRRFADHHRLEPPRQGRVLFHIFAVFIERGGADAMQFAPGERRFDQVRRIHRTFGFARADQRVHLVDEKDDFPRRRFDFLQDRLQPFLEFATVFRPGNQGAHVERKELLVAQAFRHVAVDDAQSQPLGDRGFPHAGFPDQHRVVLGAAAQHLHRAADFIVAPDDRVDLAFLCRRRQVAGIFLQRVIALLGIGAVGGAALADVVDRRVQLLRRHRARIQRILGPGVHHRQGHQHPLHRHETVTGFRRQFLGLVQHPHQRLFNVNLTVTARDFRQFRDEQIHAFLHPGGLAPGALDQIGGKPLIVIHQRLQKMLGHHPLMALAHRDGLRRLQKAARPFRELLHVHRVSP